MAVSLSLLFLVGVVSVLVLLFGQKKNKKLPPGPFGLPIIGNLLEMGSTPHLKLAEWAKVYGNIFTASFGPNRMIVISDEKLIREAYNDPNLSGRFDLDSFTILADGKHGIVNAEGQEWKEQRNFTLKNLRNFGFGKKDMEALIVEEVNDYLDFLTASVNKPTEIDRPFALAILNSIWHIVASKRYSHSDPQLTDIFDRQEKVLLELSSSLTFYVPSFAKLVPKWTGWDNVVALLEDMRGVFRQHVEEHKKTFQDNEEEPRDFIDAYLKEIQATQNPQSSFYQDVGERSLIAVVSDFFAAGPDTTAATLSWSVLYLCKFLEVQEKVQAEIDAVIGKNRRPTLADRASLPICVACIEETLRMSSVVPMGVMHKALADVTFHGYEIPKGSWIAPNNYFLHYNKDIWEEPHIFKPERHLMDDGKTIKKHEALLPFSVGKRACIGEQLARDSCFLFFTSIFQRFDIRLAPESKNVTLDPKANFVLRPQDFKVVVTERF